MWIIIINSFLFLPFSFFQGYRGTSFEKFTTSALVANRRVKYTIWDTTGKASIKSCLFITSHSIGRTYKVQNFAWRHLWTVPNFNYRSSQNCPGWLCNILAPFLREPWMENFFINLQISISMQKQAQDHCVREIGSQPSGLGLRWL